MWFSHAATVTLAGVTAAFAVEAVHARDRRRLRMLVGVAAVWIVSGAVYAGFATGAVGRLRERFASGLPDAFAPLPPTSLSDVKWYAANVHGFAQELGGSELWAVLGIGLAVVGVASLARRDAGALGLLVWPVVLVVLASGLELYPLQFRFQVFLAPTAFLLIGEGLSRVRGYVGVPSFVVLVGVLTALPLRVTVDALRDGGREEIRPLVEELASDARAGDTLYVYFASQYALSYYAQCDDCGTRPVARAFPIRRPRGSAGHERSVAGEPPSLILGRPGSLGPGRLGDDIARLSGKERAWLLFAHDVTAFDTDERELALASAARLGRMISARETTGAALYLFDFGGEP